VRFGLENIFGQTICLLDNCSSGRKNRSILNPRLNFSNLPGVTLVNPCLLSKLRYVVTQAILAAAVLGIGAPVAFAGLLTPGNVLVSDLNSGTLSEYTSSGTFVQSFTFPDFEGGFHDLRDIVVDPNGDVQAYNGTFTPRLSTLDPATATFTDQSFAGFSTVNNISFGGIGAVDSLVFVTDMSTASASTPMATRLFVSPRRTRIKT
jgi:hypothetical protein